MSLAALRLGLESTAGEEAERRAQTPAGHLLRAGDGDWQAVVYAPTQFREMIRQATATVQLPAGTSILTLAKSDPAFPDAIQPGTVDLDDVDVELVH